MKKSKFLCIVLILCVIVASFSGCSLNFFSVESLLIPPAQSGENGEIQKAFNELMKNKTVQLKSPASGEFQSPFVLYDIDADGKDEVLVFYSESNTEGSVRVLLMKEINGDWKFCDDVKGAGNGIYDVNFVDVNNDSKPEIFVSWTLMDSKTTRIVTAFEGRKGNDTPILFRSLGNEYGIAKSFVDFNGDGKKDLCLIYIDDTGSVQKSFLRLFTVSENNSLVKYGEVPLDGSIQSVLSIKNDVVRYGGGTNSRLFIDCVKNEKMIFTEMVYWDNAQAVPVRAFDDAAVSNSRSYLVQCADIDGDGLIEIPVLTTLYGNTNELSVVNADGTFVFTMLEWANVKGDNSKAPVLTLLNPIDEYLFEFNWNADVTVKYDSLREGLVFYEWNQEKSVIGSELFALMFRGKEITNEIPGELLRSEDSGDFYYQITEKGEAFGITKNSLDKSVVTIN